MVDYNKNMKFILYTQTKEIELVEKTDVLNKYHLYFRNVGEMVEAIKKSPELTKQLKEML